jgi:hypothetical protein
MKKAASLGGRVVGGLNIRIRPCTNKSGWRFPHSDYAADMPDRSELGPLARHRARSFDHFVGAGEQRRRYFEAQRLRSLQIYDQLEARWLLDWKVAGTGAL